MIMNSTRKGSAWAHKVRLWFEAAGWSVTRRPWTERGDDLVARRAGLTLSVECKDWRTYSLADWVDQANRQAEPDQVPVVVVHRLKFAGVDQAYVVMSAHVFADLLEHTEKDPMVDEIRREITDLARRMER